ncbi:ABC transporter substrate-binding protein [Ignatzschineria ureiclastica]|uniref:ABC transporter substrate-binding protein n=1 Tax=Ignatzschineria ureiclastica TaxID=472582 RepID=A0A2U2ACF0_9GAMM|nr:ABC transporter substrate-binding protein [Ignatzschineria ureiclastica]PWD80342.1 ABC transporter substrate-binding protein [Ignatzschineria ureiclastica]GHA00236.1 ABC transporter substrate-binding protein [Ignatzschineria ureiclastica]
MKKLLTIALLSGLLGTGALAQENHLKIAFADNLSSLDPQLNNFAGDRSASIFFFDTLVEDKNGGQLYPALAESWRNIDPLTWEIKLRSDILWNNGTPVTAEDVVYSIERIRNVPGSVAPFTGYVRTIDTVTILDPTTLEIKTNVPNPDLPLNLTSVYIVNKAVTEQASSEDFNSGKALVSTGAYKLVSYTPGEKVVAEKNPQYWGEAPVWDTVEYLYMPNAASRTAALLSGGVDVIDKVSVSDLARLQKESKVEVFPYDGLRVFLLQPSFNSAVNQYITDNNGKPLPTNPLLDQRVREALSIAINREAIADRILQNGVTVANQWMPKDSTGYNPDIAPIPFDAARAKTLLAEAGYPDGFQITIHVPTDRYPLAPETVQAVAQFWTRIGVKTQVEVVPWAVYSSAARQNEYAVSVIAWGNGTGEASYAMVNILATVNPEAGLGASNWGHYSSEKLDNSLKAVTTEFDSAKREALMQEAAVTVSEEVGIIPLFHYKNIWAAKKGLIVKPLRSDRTVPQMVTPQK